MSLSDPPLLAAWLGDIWYMLPLVVSISLVYAATRHELMPAILAHAARVGFWITAFMGIILAVLALAGRRL